MHTGFEPVIDFSNNIESVATWTTSRMHHVFVEVVGFEPTYCESNTTICYADMFYRHMPLHFHI